jgi:hypothetical protein
MPNQNAFAGKNILHRYSITATLRAVERRTKQTLKFSLNTISIKSFCVFPVQSCEIFTIRSCSTTS